MKANKLFRVFLFVTVVVTFVISTAGSAQGTTGAEVKNAYSAIPYYRGYPFCRVKLGKCIAVGDALFVEVAHLDQLLRRAQCQNEDGTNKPDCQKQKIVLYINDRRMNGIYAESPTVEGKLLFHLKRYKVDDPLYSNYELWSDLLQSSIFTTQLPAKISVGLENEYAINTLITEDSFRLIRLPPSWWMWLIGMVILGILMFVFAFASDMLRDSGPQLPDRTETLKNFSNFFNDRKWRKIRRRTYSLAKIQMAWWFFWVVTAFTFILIITWANDTITPGILTLIGISSGTSLGAALIENTSGKRKEITDKINAEKERIAPLKKSLKAEKDQLETRNMEIALKGPTDSFATKEAELTKQNDDVTTLNTSITRLKAAIEAETDPVKKSALEEQVKKNEAELKGKEQQITTLTSTMDDLKKWQSEKTKNEERIRVINLELNSIDGELESLYKKIESRGFALDILTDDGEDAGVSFHRFQMVVWTVVLTGIFIVSVSAQLSMPEFNPTLLALQGIVAGTYLGFKIPAEQNG